MRSTVTLWAPSSTLFTNAMQISKGFKMVDHLQKRAHACISVNWKISVTLWQGRGWNRPRLTDEPVEFWEITCWSSRLQDNYPSFLGIWKVTTCNRLDSETLEFFPIMPENSPQALAWGDIYIASNQGHVPVATALREAGQPKPSNPTSGSYPVSGDFWA